MCSHWVYILCNGSFRYELQRGTSVASSQSVQREIEEGEREDREKGHQHQEKRHQHLSAKQRRQEDVCVFYIVYMMYVYA